MLFKLTFTHYIHATGAKYIQEQKLLFYRGFYVVTNHILLNAFWKNTLLITEIILTMQTSVNSVPVDRCGSVAIRAA